MATDLSFGPSRDLAPGRADAALDVARLDDRRDRTRAGQDLGGAESDDDGRRRGRPPCRGPDERDEPRGRRASAGARRALRGDHLGADRTPSVADPHLLADRSGRSGLARRPDHRPLHAARRGLGRDLCRDDLRRAPAATPAGTSPRSSSRSWSTTCRSRSGGRASHRSGRPRRTTCSRTPTGSSIDGSSWGGDGFGSVRQLARLTEGTQLAVFDFALVRQSRWREAIASTFDLPDFLPYLRSIRRIAVTYGTHDELGRPGTTNMVKPLYHVAWIGSRLGMTVSRPLAPIAGPVGAGDQGSARRSRAAHAAQTTHAPGKHAGVKPVAGRGYTATLRHGSADVAVVMRPVCRGMPSGTTLRVELLAERRGSELRVDVTAEAETVAVHAWQDGVELLDRRFNAPRRTEIDLLAEAIEAPHRDIVSEGAIRMAAGIVGAARGRDRVDRALGPARRPAGRAAAGRDAGERTPLDVATAAIRPWSSCRISTPGRCRRGRADRADRRRRRPARPGRRRADRRLDAGGDV